MSEQHLELAKHIVDARKTLKAFLGDEYDLRVGIWVRLIQENKAKFENDIFATAIDILKTTKKDLESESFLKVEYSLCVFSALGEILMTEEKQPATIQIIGE